MIAVNEHIKPFDFKKILAPFFVGTIFVLLFVWPRLPQQLGPDEVHMQMTVENEINTGRPTHFLLHQPTLHSPHAWTIVNSRFQKIFSSSSLQGSRCFGVVCLVLTLLLGCRYSKNPWLFALIFSLSPAMIQGALVVDIENTLMVPVFLLWMISFWKYESSKVPAYFLILIGAFALWCRVTTPMLILGLWSCWPLLRFNWVEMRKRVLISAATFLLFLGTWYIYCQLRQFDFVQPFRYTVNAFVAKGGGGLTTVAKRFTKSFIESFLWFGLPMYVLIVLSLCKSVVINKRSRFHFVGITLLFAAYWVVGGTTFGFPKYQVPIMAVLIWNAVEYIKPFRVNKQLIFLMGLMAILFMIHPDPIYDFRMTLRKAMVFGSRVEALWLLWPALLVPFISVIVLRFKKIPYLNIAVIVFLLQGFILNVAQSTSGYQTGYSYGNREPDNLFVERLKTNFEKVQATNDFFYHYGVGSYKKDDVWQEEKMRSFLMEPSKRALVLNMTTNTPGQIKTMLEFQKQNSKNIFVEKQGLYYLIYSSYKSSQK